MNKLKIGVDLDNCVYDFSSKFISLCKANDSSYKPDYSRWDFGLKEEEFEYNFRIFCNNKMFQSLNLLPNAQEVLCILDSMGIEIHYITIRPKSAIRPTLKRILKDGLPISGIVFCENDEKKVRYAKDNEICLAIEDKPDIIEMYENNGIKVIKMLYGYNADITSSFWVKDCCWKEIINIVKYINKEQKSE